MSEDKSLEMLMQSIRSALEDLKAVNIEEIDVSDKTSMTEMMVIATGTSSRHVKAIADNVVEKCKENQFRPLGSEGEELSEWVLVDFGDVIVHVMQAKVRDFYQIEKLWKVGLGNREMDT